MASGTWDWQGANSWSAARLVFSSSSNGSAANSSKVTLKLYARRSDGGTSYNYNTSNNFWVKCNGQTLYGTCQKVSGTSWTLVCSKSFTVAHNSDGTKTTSVAGGGSIPGTSFNINSLTKSVTLDKIPRYATITTWANTDVTQVSASFKWAANATCDAVQYALNGGSWVSTSGSTFTISGLTPNTSYNVKIRVRRKDSQLWTTSTNVSVKTNPIVTLSNGDSLGFNIGEDIQLEFLNYDQNASYIRFTIQQEGQTDQWTESVLNVDIDIGTQEYTLLTSTVSDLLYQNCVNSNQVNFRVFVGTDINEKTYGTTYNGVAKVINSNPVFSNFTYSDSNESVIEMLGNTSYMLQNYGNMRATISVADKAMAVNYATIVSYSASVTNSSNGIQVAKTIPYSSDSDITIDFGYFSAYGTYQINIAAIDSRGNRSNIVQNTFYVLPYHLPSLQVTIERVNEFEQEVTLHLASVYSKVLLSGVPKNEIVTLQYRYREAGSTSWSQYTVIDEYDMNDLQTNDVILTLVHTEENPFISLPSEKSYEFEFSVTDKILSVSNTFTLVQGIPIMVEGDNGVIGIGMIPDWDSPSLLQVNSDIIAKDENGDAKGVMAEIKKLKDSVDALNAKISEKVEVPITINTDYVSAYIGACYYYPFLNACYLKIRFARSATLDGGTGGIEYTLATIPEEYLPTFVHPLSVYAAQGNTTANIYGFINSLGSIGIRMNGSTNPTYYYLSGFWVLG